MFSYQVVPPEIQKRIRSEAIPGKYIRIKYNDPNPVLKHWPAEYCFLPDTFIKCAKIIKDFKVRDDDIWILSYPKCGTTWTQEMVWIMVNNMDFEGAKSIETTVRVPFLEVGAIGAPDMDSVKILDDMTSRRIIKSHLPINLLPNELWKSKAKIVYVARNPKDAAVSFYHHNKGFESFPGTLEDFLEDYLIGNVLFGSYFHHVNEFWQLAKSKENMLFITFEEMKFDMMKVLWKMNEFLGTGHSEEKLEELEEHLKFDNMKKLPMSNMSSLNEIKQKIAPGPEFVFMRKGQVGSFKEEMSKELQAKFDKEIEKWNGIHDFQKKISKNV